MPRWDPSQGRWGAHGPRQQLLSKYFPEEACARAEDSTVEPAAKRPRLVPPQPPPPWCVNTPPCAREVLATVAALALRRGLADLPLSLVEEHLLPLALDPEVDRDEVVEAFVGRARRTNASTLDLASLNMRELPRAAAAATHVTYLTLADNPLLERLPTGLSELTRLRALNVARTAVRALPPLPPSLWTLDARHAALEGIPAAVRALPALADLRVDDNPLACGGETLAELAAVPTLTALSAQRCRLAAVPPALGALTRLATLNLAGNYLRDLPPELRALTALTELVLASNALAALPRAALALPALVELDASRNAIAELPPAAALTALRSLRALRLSHTSLRTAPPRLIAALPALRELAVDGCAAGFKVAPALAGAPPDVTVRYTHMGVCRVERVSDARWMLCLPRE